MVHAIERFIRKAPPQHRIGGERTAAAALFRRNLDELDAFVANCPVDGRPSIQKSEN